MQALEGVCLCICAVCFCLMNLNECAYLDTNVVVVFLSLVNKHGEQGQDGVRAEEGALRPDDCC